MRSPAAVAVALAACALLCGCGRSRGETVTILVSQLAFSPAVAVAHVGDRVRWENRDILAHTATAGNGAFDVALPVGGQGEARLERTGTLFYACRYHPGMKGEIRVEN